MGVIVAGYEVPHTHVHLIPTSSMAQLSFANAAASVDRDDLDAWADAIRRELSRRGRCRRQRLIGSISSGRLLRTLLTSVDTACIVEQVVGRGHHRASWSDLEIVVGRIEPRSPTRVGTRIDRHPVVDRAPSCRWLRW